MGTRRIDWIYGFHTVDSDAECVRWNISRQGWDASKKLELAPGWLCGYVVAVIVLSCSAVNIDKSSRRHKAQDHECDEITNVSIMFHWEILC